MARTPPHRDLTRRERQVMDVVYRLGRATAAEVMEQLPDSPSYSAVRTFLRILEEKGHIEHEQEGARYVYFPTMAQETAGKSALKHMVGTFFGGSTEAAVAALLDLSADDVSETELDRLARLIDQARKQGR